MAERNHLILETFAREWSGSVLGHEGEGVRSVGLRDGAEGGGQWPASVRLGRSETASGREQALRASQVESETGQGGGNAVAGGAEVGHAREAVAALDRTEDFLDGAADQREIMVVLDLGGAERLALARPTHQPVTEALRDQLRPQGGTVIGAIAIDRAGLGRQQRTGDAHVLNISAGEQHRPDQARAVIDRDMQLVAEAEPATLVGGAKAGVCP